LRTAIATDGPDIAGIVDKVVSAHSIDEWTSNGVKQYGIADQFFCGAGLKMISEESKRMRVVIQCFTDAKKPALMIHDAVVCKRSDSEFAKRAMTEAHQCMYTTEFRPVIKCEF
jgi:hypothetical protein